MIRHWKESIWISDAHGGGGGPADDLVRHAPLLEALLYECLVRKMPVGFAGDMEECWQFTTGEIRRQHASTFAPARDLQYQGRLHVCPGNHDAETSGMVELINAGWASENVIVDTGAGLFWIEHGNRFDRYNRRPNWGHRLLLAVGKRLERIHPDADVLDRYRRASDRKRVDPSKDSLYRGAEMILSSGRFAGVVLGHTHRGGLWVIQTEHGPRVYANCGSWAQAHTPSVVIIRGGGMRFLSLDRGKDSIREIWAS